MSMPFGFSSYAVGWRVSAGNGDHAAVADDLVALAARLGYQRLQIADNCPLHALTVGQRRDLHRRAAEASISIEVGARGLTERNLTTYIRIAAEFESPLLRMVIDEEGYEPDHESIIGLLRSGVRSLEVAGVTLAIENHDRFMARELAGIVSAVDSAHVAICLDTANSMGAGEDLHTVLAHLAPLTVNLHLKDVRVRRLEHLQGFIVEGTPLGQGQLPIAWAIGEMARHGRCRSATLEHWVPPEPELERTLQKEREWCEVSTSAMRRLFASTQSR